MATKDKLAPHEAALERLVVEGGALQLRLLYLLYITYRINIAQCKYCTYLFRLQNGRITIYANRAYV